MTRTSNFQFLPHFQNLPQFLKKCPIFKIRHIFKKCPIFKKNAAYSQNAPFKKCPTFNGPDLKQARRTGLSARRARRTKSTGLQLEVGAPRLLVSSNLHLQAFSSWSVSMWGTWRGRRFSRGFRLQPETLGDNIVFSEKLLSSISCCMPPVLMSTFAESQHRTGSSKLLASASGVYILHYSGIFILIKNCHF